MKFIGIFGRGGYFFEAFALRLGGEGDTVHDLRLHVIRGPGLILDQVRDVPGEEGIL